MFSPIKPDWQNFILTTWQQCGVDISPDHTTAHTRKDLIVMVKIVRWRDNTRVLLQCRDHETVHLHKFIVEKGNSRSHMVTVRLITWLIIWLGRCAVLPLQCQYLVNFHYKNVKHSIKTYQPHSCIYMWCCPIRLWTCSLLPLDHLQNEKAQFVNSTFEANGNWHWLDRSTFLYSQRFLGEFCISSVLVLVWYLFDQT